MDIEKLDMQSPDLVNQNIEKLAELFPNCVTESDTGKAIDFQTKFIWILARNVLRCSINPFVLLYRAKPRTDKTSLRRMCRSVQMDKNLLMLGMRIGRKGRPVV